MLQTPPLLCRARRVVGTGPSGLAREVPWEAEAEVTLGGSCHLSGELCPPPQQGPGPLCLHGVGCPVGFVLTRLMLSP